MTKLPVCSGRNAVKVFEKLGFIFDHQRGSHIILRHHQPPYRRLTIPDHKELAKGTLRKLIRESGLSVEQFASML